MTTVAGRWFLHLGLHKTATSFFQRSVYPSFSGIRYLRKAYLQYMVSARPDETLVICQEALLRHMTGSDQSRHISNLASMLPDATPILMLRRQDGWLRSAYNQYVKDGGSLPFERFFDLGDDLGLIKQAELAFADIVDLLKAHFTSEPLVLIYEDFTKDPEAVIRIIAERMGAEVAWERIRWKPENSSLGEPQAALLRRINPHLAGPYNPSGRLPLRGPALRRRGLDIVSLVRRLPNAACRGPSQLIDAGQLEAVRERYAADWEQCLTLAIRPPVKS